MALRVTAIVLECSIVTVNDNDPPNVGLYSASAARPDVGWYCTVLCYTCLYSEKETQGPARLRPGKKGGREGRSRC